MHAVKNSCNSSTHTSWCTPLFCNSVLFSLPHMKPNFQCENMPVSHYTSLKITSSPGFFSRAISHGILLRRSLNKSKPALLKSRVVIMLFVQLPPLRILNSIIPWSLQVRLPLTFTSHMPVGMKSSRSASLCQLLDHLGQEFVINAYQKPPGLPVPY